MSQSWRIIALSICIWTCGGWRGRWHLLLVIAAVATLTEGDPSSVHWSLPLLTWTTLCLGLCLIKSLDDIAALDEVVCIVLVVGLAFVGGLVVELDGPPLTTSSITSAPIGLLDGSGLVAGIGSCGVRSPSGSPALSVLLLLSGGSSSASGRPSRSPPSAALCRGSRCKTFFFCPNSYSSTASRVDAEANNDPMAPIAVWEERQGSKSRARAAVTTMMF